jgi:hypothetical protein
LGAFLHRFRGHRPHPDELLKAHRAQLEGEKNAPLYRTVKKFSGKQLASPRSSSPSQVKVQQITSPAYRLATDRILAIPGD